MLQLLRRRPAFFRFWLAGLTSQAGDWLSYVAVSLLALEQGAGEGALAVALVLLAHSLPHALLAPVSGILADRFDRRSMLFVTHALEGLATLGMLAGAVAGSLLTVEVLLVLRAGIAALAWPARTAAFRSLVEPDELLTANALAGATWSAVFALGMAAGGVLASFGPELALAVDAATFGLAAALIVTLPAMKPALGQSSPGFGRAFEALRVDPALFQAVLAKLPLAMAGGGAWVVLNLLAEDLAFIGTAALTLGMLQLAKGAGTGIGPVLAERLGGGPRVGAAVNLVGLLGIAAFLATQEPIVLVFTSLIWGIGSGGNWVLAQAELQERAPAGMLGRLSGLDVLAMTLGQSLAAVATAGAIELGIPGSAAASAWLLAGAAVFVLLQLRSLRTTVSMSSGGK